MRVLFFGRLRDLAGVAEFDAPEPQLTLAHLRDWIADKNTALASALDHASIRIAVDQKIITRRDIELHGAREVAFMPPMSGG
jgi:sulfur-carrier protein